MRSPREHRGEDIAPNPGSKRASRVEENPAADSIELSAEQIQRLNDLTPATGERHDEANIAAIDDDHSMGGASMPGRYARACRHPIAPSGRRDAAASVRWASERKPDRRYSVGDDPGVLDATRSARVGSRAWRCARFPWCTPPMPKRSHHLSRQTLLSCVVLRTCPGASGSRRSPTPRATQSPSARPGSDFPLHEVVTAGPNLRRCWSCSAMGGPPDRAPAVRAWPDSPAQDDGSRPAAAGRAGA